jgi:hypothetical protein
MYSPVVNLICSNSLVCLYNDIKKQSSETGVNAGDLFGALTKRSRFLLVHVLTARD